jgi:hypothetical protein
MRNVKARLEKLERQIPKELPPLIIITNPNDVPFTPEEEAVLQAEQNRRLKSRNSLRVMLWSRKEAQRLMALARKEDGDTYFGSIGGWKKSLDDDSIIHAFYDFRGHRTKQMAEEFLRKHGIDHHWI